MANAEQIIDSGDLIITVSNKVVSHLSTGLYRNFARAIKELISNSYDAGAREVKINLDLDASPPKIIIRDDGKGMDKTEIEGKFLKIGAETPLTEDEDEMGRKRVGTFGIGCISVFPYCKNIKLISKKRDEDIIIEIDIDSEKFSKEIFDMGKDAKSKVPFKEIKSDIPREKGETIIILEDIKPHIVKELKHDVFSGNSSIEKFGGLQKFKWSLSQYAPLEFSADRQDLAKIFEKPKRVPMRIWVNGEELFRNVPQEAKILESGEEKFNDVELKYAIMSPYGTVKPGEAKGLQIRLRNVAINTPTDFEIIALTGKVPGKLNWLCGEVHINKGLSSSLMIDRDSFSFTQEVSEIHDFFRKKMRYWNDKLEKYSKEDKDVYEVIGKLKNSEIIEKEFKKAGILRVPKERLRMSKAPIVKSRKKGVSSISKKLTKALSHTNYEVVTKKEPSLDRKLPIEIKFEEKKIIVYEKHSDFLESMEVYGKHFKIDYDEWGSEKTPFKVCKLLEGNKVIFNKSHPLFKSKLDDEIIKKLTLGLLLIVKNNKNEKELLENIYRLLEEIFL